MTLTAGSCSCDPVIQRPCPNGRVRACSCWPRLSATPPSAGPRALPTAPGDEAPACLQTRPHAPLGAGSVPATCCLAPPLGDTCGSVLPVVQGESSAPSALRPPAAPPHPGPDGGGGVRLTPCFLQVLREDEACLPDAFCGRWVCQPRLRPGTTQGAEARVAP